MGNFCSFGSAKQTQIVQSVRKAHNNGTNKESFRPQCQPSQVKIRPTSQLTVPKGPLRPMAVPRPVARVAAPTPVVRTNINANRCKACGDREHSHVNCRYATRLCFTCRQMGHISRVCPTRRGARDNSRSNRTASNQ